MSFNLLAKSIKRSGLIFVSATLVCAMIVPGMFASSVHAAPINLIANPQVETVDPSNANAPADWQTGSWGTNTFTASYLKSGPTNDPNSVEINMTAYTSGDAKWYFNPVDVTGGSQYTFSDSYESNVTTDVVAEFIDGSGNATYQDLGNELASSSWNQAADTFTVPSTAVSMTIFHLINSVGSLTISNFSLIPSSTPSVSITSPTANGVVSGKSVELEANASDADGITSVQFQVNGVSVGAPVTASPYDYNWDSTTVANGTYNLSAVATNMDGVSTTSSLVAISVDNTAPLGANMIANPQVETVDPSNANAPADWQTGSWGTNTFTASYLKSGPTNDPNSVEINMTAYTSGDAKWYFNPVDVTGGTEYTYSDSYQSTTASEVVVAYTMSDGSAQYATIGSLAASSSWQTFSASFVAPTGAVSATVYHLVQSVGSLTTSNFSLAGSTAPTVVITAPTASTATSTPYSGTVTLAASATDNTGVASVQFQIDGNNVGTPITASPYQYSWNSASVTNGTHSVTAIVTNVNNQTTASVPVSIEVSNTAPASSNLIPNPQMSTPSSTTPTTAPQDWTVDTWGTNTFTASYLKSGSAGDPYSVEINMTAYTSGDAKWVFTPQNVSQDTQYEFTDYYESNVQTLVNAVFTMSDGSTEYEILGTPYVATTWTEFSSKFSVPAGAVNMTIYHLIENVGYLSIDNTSLTSYVPTGFTSPIVTLTFDDGYETEYSNALPILEQYGFTSTQFIITDLIGQSGYMTAQLKALYGDGDEIASHTVTHDDLTQETSTQLTTEMTQSKATLVADTGENISDMAYPYGLYNANVMNAAKTYYNSARGVESGLNSKDNFNQYDLKVEDVYTTTTTAQISDWVAQAQATNTWLIFVYHGVDTDVNNAVDGDIYDVPPAQLSAQMAAIKASGVNVETLGNALASVDSQMGIATPQTVTFNANGGTGTMASETESTATDLSANKYTRTGYTFSGWNTAANGTGTAYANDASYPFTSSATLYAQWAANVSYSVTFNANGGTGTMASETQSKATALTANKFTRIGYTFSGWNTSANGTGTAYANDASYPFTASTTLYAQWKANTSFTVTFNANGGTGTMASETQSKATALTANKFTRIGYTFSGWNTSANGTGTAYANDASYPFTASTTLYAQWKKTTTIII